MLSNRNILLFQSLLYLIHLCLYNHSLGRPISNIRGVFLLCFIAVPVFNENSADPDQRPRSAASDLGLLCLPMSAMGR